MKHKKQIQRYTTESLARAIASLHYEALKETLQRLSACLQQDAEADAKRNRPQLANALAKAAQNIKAAQENISEAWEISKPYMTNKTERE